MRPYSSRAALYAALALFGLAIAIVQREMLTALMSLHMLVQIPLLLLAGVFLELACRTLLGGSWLRNDYGIAGLLLVSLVTAGWMIPKALDDALVDWRVAALKYAGLPVCGWILAASWRRAPGAVRLFFLGNFCWMSAIVGLVYLDQPLRLCNAYLQDDQYWAGRGLIALAVALPLLWGWAEWRKTRRFAR
jgi:hypothetical protein